MASLFVLVLDYDPKMWKSLGFSNTVQQSLIFLNSFLALDLRNKVAVVLAHPKSTRILYPAAVTLTVGGQDSGKLERFQTMNDIVVDQISAALREPPHGTTSLASALSKAFCYINKEISRIAKATKVVDVELETRVLVLSAGGDGLGQYINMMNCIFAGQNKGTRIDACIVGHSNDQNQNGNSNSSFDINTQPASSHKHTSTLLQQATDLTGGIYTEVSKSDMSSLLQHLLCIYLGGEGVARHLVLPTKSSIDFRPACYCHGTAVDTYGFVCSECLTVFCDSGRPKKPAGKSETTCTVCKTALTT